MVSDKNFSYSFSAGTLIALENLRSILFCTNHFSYPHFYSLSYSFPSNQNHGNGYIFSSYVPRMMYIAVQQGIYISYFLVLEWATYIQLQKSKIKEEKVELSSEIWNQFVQLTIDKAKGHLFRGT